MLTFLVKFTALDGKERALRRALEALAAESRREAGCDLCFAHSVPNAPGQFVLYERWRDNEALHAHNVGPSLDAFARRLPELVSTDPEVSTLEPIGA